MTVSLCITTFNRFDLTMKSFENVLNDDRVSEIIIVDDCSTDGSYEKLRVAVSDCSKIRLFRNEVNLGMSRNKLRAIELANTWAIILDSDNIIDSGYLDALENHKLYGDTIYMPEAALPNFDFRKFAGLVIDRHNVASYMNDPMFRICMNTCNYVVYKDMYKASHRYDPAIKGTDTISHNLNHLKAGGSFFIVPRMTYTHLVHAGSGFMADCDYNMNKAKETENKMRRL